MTIKNSLSIIKNILVIIILVACSSTFAQNNTGKIILSPNDRQAGQHFLPYEFPSIESIENVITRVREYLDSGTPFKIIDRTTRQPITDFLVLNQNADIDNGEQSLFSIWRYETGVTIAGMLNSSKATGDKKYSEYALKIINFYFDHLPYFRKIDSAYGEISNSYDPLIHTGNLDDCGSMGAALIRLYKINKDPRLKEAIDHIADFISNKQFRLADGTLARQRPQAQSIWADDAYMSIPFLAEMGSLIGGENKYFDDAVKQVLQMSKYLYRPDKGIFDHGVNIHNEYDPNIYWGRANGWIIVSIVDLLDVLPENYKGRDEILKILRLHVKGLTEFQSKDGFWNNLLDRVDSYPETSCTALFTYSIAHAINKGWIDYTFGPVAQAGWNALVTQVLPNGQVGGTCIATTFANDNIYYYYRPASVYARHGYGPLLLAGSEIIKLRQNNKIVILPANGTFHYRLKSDLKK